VVQPRREVVVVQQPQRDIVEERSISVSVGDGVSLSMGRTVIR
jgi:hypothetical protein